MHLKAGADIEQALERTFVSLEEGLLAQEAHSVRPRGLTAQKISFEFSGCAALAAVVHEGQVTVAHVGDSRAIVGGRTKGGGLRVRSLNRCHNATQQDEAARVR